MTSFEDSRTLSIEHRLALISLHYRIIENVFKK